MTIISTSAITLPIGNVKFPKAQGYGARIDDLWVRLAPDPGSAPYRVYTRDIKAQRQDDEGSIYENILEIGFAYARTDLSGGEGLDWDPRQSALAQGEARLDMTRFWDSANIDTSREVPGQPYSLRLTREPEDWVGTATSPNDIAASRAFIYVADGQIVSWYPDWNTGTATSSDDVGVVVAAMAASPNDNVMVVGVDGKLYYKKSTLGAFTMIYDPSVGSDPDVTAVWFVKGRWVIAQTDGTLSELSTVGAPADGISPITPTVFDTSEGVYWSVVESGPAIVAAVDDGTVRTYTPYLDSDDPATVGQLIPRARIDMPTGEYAYLLGDVAGTLLILTIAEDETGATAVRAYNGSVLDQRFDYVIGGLQLRRQWFQTDEAPDVTRNMVTLRDELFWTIIENDGISWLWRLDAVTTGLSRHLEASTNPLFSITSFEEIIGAREAAEILVLNNTSALFQPGGYLITPNITFGLDTALAWLSTVLEANNIEPGARVELYRTTDPSAINDRNSPTWNLLRRLTNDLQSGVEVPIVNLESRTVALKIEIVPNVARDETPFVTRTQIRAIQAKRDWIVELPVNISDNIEVPGRRPVRIPDYGDAVHNALLDRVGKNVELVVLDPPLVFRGIVNNVLEPTDWISPRGSSGIRAILEFRGDRVTATEVPTGDAGLGLGLLGVTTLGVGQTGA